MKVLPNLTGLRFILAFLVMIYHIPQFCMKRGFPYFDDFALFHKGQEAVYMFFSLSGFLIIGKLYSEKLATNTIDLKAFFVKRALRILPLYYLVLTFGFLYYWIILPYYGFSYENNYNLAKGIILSYTFFPNIFATYNPGGIIEILWSIGIEEQFYLIIAPLIFVIPFKYLTRFLILFTALYFLLYFSDVTSFSGVTECYFSIFQLVAFLQFHFYQTN